MTPEWSVSTHPPIVPLYFGAIRRMLTISIKALFAQCTLAPSSSKMVCGGYHGRILSLAGVPPIKEGLSAMVIQITRTLCTQSTQTAVRIKVVS